MEASERILRFVFGEAQRFHLSKADIARASPEIAEAVRLLRERTPAGIEYGIALLEADPWCFRSGYLKGDISRYLRKIPLSEQQRERLRAAILNTLQKGNRLEFGETRRLARRLDTPKFRKAIEKFLKHPDAGTRERAALLLESCKLNETRGDLRGVR